VSGIKEKELISRAFKILFKISISIRQKPSKAPQDDPAYFFAAFSRSLSDGLDLRFISFKARRSHVPHPKQVLK